MSRGWLLDTNVLSELSKGSHASPAVIDWIDQVPEDRLYVSVITLGEIAKGIDLAESRGRDIGMQRRFVEDELPERFDGRILAFDAAAAIAWGRLMAGLQGNREVERQLALDAQIAAIAQIAFLEICSRNVRDFERLGIAPITNPFVLA